MVDGPRDSYDLETGLKQQFDITVDRAEFTTDAGYNNAQTLCLILEGVDGDGDPQRLLFPCSPGWIAGNGGQTAEREDGAQNRTFNQNSGIGGLILAALQCGAPLRDRGPATQANIWPGLSFRFERKKINEGTQFETTRALPSAFLGIGTANPGQVQAAAAPAPAAPAQTAAAPASAPAPAPAVMPNGANGGLDKLTEAKLKKLAKEVASHDQFMEQGLDLTAGNPAAEAVLADPNFFNAARA